MYGGACGRRRFERSWIEGEADHEQHAGDEQDRDEAHEELENSDEREPEADGGGKDCAAAALPRGRRGHNRAGVQARQFGDGDEPESPLSQTRDQPRDGGNGLAPVAASVVEHDDPARGPGRARAAYSRGHSPPPPVLGVVVGQDDEVTAPCKRSEGPLLVRGDRGGCRRVRRPHEPRVATGDSGDHRLGEVELEAALPTRAARECDMGEGVVAELETVAGEHADDVRMAGRFAPDEEERRRHVLTTQQGSNPRRPARIRAVVEGERNATARRRLRGDEVIRPSGQHRPAVCEWRRPARLLDGRPARPDRVGGDSLEQDRDRGNDEAERQQAPVCRKLQPPECGRRAHHGLRGEVDGVVVVRPGAVPLRPRGVVVEGIVFV